MKVAAERPDDIWLARSGFGGTEYLLSSVFSEGSRRGIAYAHMAEVLAWNPARRFGLLRKGDVAPGYDADLALLDPARRFTVRARAGRRPIHPQLSTGFPASPTYPHLGDNRVLDPYSWG